MAHILVTGVNGFVGQHLARALQQAGHSVHGTGREPQLTPALSGVVTDFSQCDLTKYEQVAELPLKSVSAVIDLAGLATVGDSFAQPDHYLHVNTEVLRTVCEAALEQQAQDLRIVAISSGAIYDSQQPMPLTEDSRLAPESSPYAASKIAMEQIAQTYRDQGLDCVVARPFNHIGPGQLAGFLLPDLYEKATAAHQNGQPLLVGNLTTQRDYTDVRDVAAAYVALATQPALHHSVYNVCSGRARSGQEILQLLLQQLGYQLEPQVDEQLFRPSDAPLLYGDNKQLGDEVHWQPTIPIEQAVSDFVKARLEQAAV